MRPIECGLVAALKDDRDSDASGDAGSVRIGRHARHQNDESDCGRGFMAARD
jgi:hypothetical protein